MKSFKGLGSSATLFLGTNRAYLIYRLILAIQHCIFYGYFILSDVLIFFFFIYIFIYFNNCASYCKNTNNSLDVKQFYCVVRSQIISKIHTDLV